MFANEQKQSTGDINKKIAPASVPIKELPSSMCVVSHNGIRVNSMPISSSAPQTLIQSGENMVNTQSYTSPRNINKSLVQYTDNMDHKKNSAKASQSTEKFPSGSKDSCTLSAHETNPNKLLMTVSDQQKIQRTHSNIPIITNKSVTYEGISVKDQTTAENVHNEFVNCVNSNFNASRLNSGNPYAKEHKPKDSNSCMTPKHQERQESYASNEFGKALANITNIERSRIQLNANNKVSSECLKRSAPTSSTSICNKRVVTNPYNKLKSLL